MIPRFLVPVYGFAPGHYFQREAVATFFSHGDAADFAMRPERFGSETRNLYVGAGRYDRRSNGYRP